MNEEIIQNLNERIDRALAKSREMVEDEKFQQRVQELKDRAETTIRKHPVKSVVIGLTIGFLIGKLINSDD